ncbi:hypothetical protein AMS68_001830 [Peltaster fructicola]|uniref:Px domain containing protein n=1 Tax=Peltaster fructicola TaxID=286661 RepID=A0A6H0XNM0_9PEZI|nr:hypothetical protein AMS68_001830 [Peltaster fructicola]
MAVASTTENTDLGSLTPQQYHALFDILTHQETYNEIANFKYPDTINHYGPPFQDSTKSSTSPILQTLLSKFILKLPGLRDVPADFWKVQVAELIEDLSKAELSESYDKGVLGIRKTLATAGSALIEYPARGSLGGYAEVKSKVPEDKRYDTQNPQDVLQAWKDALQAAVYGNFVTEVFEKAAETDDLERHTSLTRAVHEFIVVNVASIMHYALILSPEGPSILRLIESVHKLIPYTLIRQSLKIGNVATMLSGVMRIILAKVSMGSVTNWIGLSSGADEGMNLMQQIISQVLGWEKRELRNRATKIEKDRDSPPKAVLAELKDWVDNRTRAEHDECRRQSQQQQKSIVTVILSLSSVSEELTSTQHEKAQEYLMLNLSQRDRQEIIQVLCKRNPDHLTAAVRVGVDAYTPMIRHVHQAVNLSESMWDAERFITDMLKTSKPQGKKGQEQPPPVQDFVDLLHRHQGNLHKFLHQVAKNGKEVTAWWHDYCLMAVREFRADVKTASKDSVIPADLTDGGTQPKMQEVFAKLPEKDKTAVLSELAAHQQYLDDLHAASAARIAAVITRSGKTPYGPGAYLSRWQQLMDETAVTPATASGPVRHGNSSSVKDASRQDIDGTQPASTAKAADGETPTAPSVGLTLKLFGDRFREVLAGA